ncbi:MAG: glycoside hydrolase family 3 C-terminal domain-containing protein [Clostridia bacterium]|nr:glycoside hydrolase family 3 C-terminal domain-containing protein [Clostridia bacterium]
MVNAEQKIEQRIDEIMSGMTLHEKVEMCHANSKFTSAGVPSRGIDELTMNDGPHGVREENHRHIWRTMGRTDDFCTYLPTGTALTATWNRSLGYLHGEVLGEEARYRNKDIILGPGVNIIRTPLCGRNFEYMSEDPCLAAGMVPGIIKGIQSTDTAACVKHYALNNQELDRSHVNAELSERALREIYLPAFKAAADAGAYSFMGAYNRYKGQHCCHNKELVNDILKGEWGWDGVYLSDWAGVHDTEEAARYGMDIEMGTSAEDYKDYYLADAFEKLCERDGEYVRLLDDKVRRILRLMLRVNKLSPDRKRGSFNTKEHQQATYDIAKEAIVLLKNQGILPLKKDVRKLLVVGENADMYHSHGGNSSAVKAFYEITPLRGLINRFGAENVEYIKSTRFQYEPIPIEYLDIADMRAGCRAFRMECYDNGVFEGEAKVYFVDKVAQLHDGVSRIFTAVLNIPESGDYAFYLNGDRGTKFYFNNELVWYFKSSNNGIPYELTRHFEKGERVDIRVEAITVGMVPLEFLWSRSAEEMPIEALLDKARAADAVIYCGGLNHSYDTESFDKPDMGLPGEQNELIPLLAAANPNTVVTVTAGSPVEMPWVDKVGAIVWSWYAGMEGGNALADILCGNVCPSGKMPFTLPYKLEDSPAHRYGEYQADNCRYNEDIFVGYRGFEKDGIRPMFAFGHGLSYASFEYSDLEVVDVGEALEVSFSVKNTSDTDAKETAQVYFGREGAEDRPVKELKGFEKLTLRAGECQRTTVTVRKESLRVWDNGWRLCEGTYTVSVAAACDDVRLTATVDL